MNSHELLSAALGFIFGAIIGSYLTCATWRIPRRMSLGGRSICPACGVELKARWNIPIFGWLLLRGRTACCGTTLSPRYPLIELASALVGAGVAALAGFGVVFAAGAGIVILSVLVSVSTVKRGG